MWRTTWLKTTRLALNRLKRNRGCLPARAFCSGQLGIQLLPNHIRERVFPSTTRRESRDINDLEAVKEHLEKHQLWGRKSEVLADVRMEIPELLGKDIEEHFRKIGERYTRPYVDAANKLIKAAVPPIPARFAFKEGWVRYSTDGKAFESVEAPHGDAIVFDVETVVSEGGLPVMAVALSDECWYTWCSTALVDNRDQHVERVTTDVLISLGPGNREQVVIGHHVGFDRSFVKEEYDKTGSKRRFLDTLSMHVCVSGRTTEQKIKLIRDSQGEGSVKSKRKKSWYDVSASNSLADVYRFYCNKELAKSLRKTFEKGTSNDVREDFQDLMRYTVNDVKATRDVFVKLFPIFRKRLPHPVSFFGIMEMLTAYLPINNNWIRYISQADAVYNDVNTEIKLILNMIADRACRMSDGEAWKKDPWLWDLDWSTQKIKPRKSYSVYPEGFDSMKHIPKRQPLLSGYPKWYRDLCCPVPSSMAEVANWEFGAWNISTQMRCVPKLMKLMWDGYPLHYHEKHGWGYLVPTESGASPEESQSSYASDKSLEKSSSQFPLAAYKKVIAESRKNATGRPVSVFEGLDQKHDATSIMKDEFRGTHMKDVPGEAIGIQGVLFKKLPHKNGEGYNVGNPLSKDFISQVDGNTLRSWEDDEANTLLKLSKQVTYWKNSRDRLKEQLVVWTGENQGAILPRLMPAGTVSRRAVEKLWLTASNSKKDRIGSELKTIIQAPVGMHFVGADVDSQELWIASLLGDAAFKGLHGCTAFGWMTLQGKKADGTDMHSRTAATVGCSRDHAKVLNYARIYGAGERLSANLLRQFNPSMTAEDAANRAKIMFRSTKGARKWLNKGGDQAKRQWTGGTESHMFNKLEEVATGKKTSTPVLGARITRALESDIVGANYMTSRVNWVVQSSAVDYLHLMLASMKDLAERFDLGGRFVVSIHDEVRFMVQSEKRYRASLALHITNLFVRALFAKKLGFDDLPFNVAFFSAVDIDKVIRKEVTDDSITPSNPHGLNRNYGIPYGEELDIYKTVERTDAGKLRPEAEKKPLCAHSGLRVGRTMG
ncbi:DNA polymerase subunit gamma-1-like [Tropilaelaps mercedesae]|uniref:DNA polymerase subunit gamma-1 n=1 Tax=Tropilaelaps mercedesae TaxID=418985 RepID=A0A1V9XF69_9ACAR|nr:DNA polymerase subunit gamma-1-like [Tropilaelaps mercedesae]